MLPSPHWLGIEHLGIAVLDLDAAELRYTALVGEGLHHVAYAVADLQAELDRLDAAGVALIHRHPKPGADGKIIAFLHPKATGGSLIELCQSIEDA
jgi:methylmalonyl-CoA/ethylmalonyl-CoA epimerase